jgi:predicted  nucleic acid-binding Zn-ribbon protein
VKATPQDQNELLRLQAVDTRAQQLEHTRASLPQVVALAALAPNVDDARRRFASKNGELEDARAELRRVESDVAVVEARLTRDAERLQTTSSMKDVQALEGEVDALKKRRSDLEDIELTVMERIEGMEAELAEIVAERDVLGGKVAELEAAKLVEQRSIEAELGAAKADRNAIAAPIPADLLALYEKQRARYGVGAALLLRGVSMGSNVTLTQSDMQEIRTASPDEVVLCPDSGAILIRNEDSGL